MTTTTSIAILGASDPEMVLIEECLRRAGIPTCLAAAPGRDGVLSRVTPGTAYRAEAVLPCGPKGQQAVDMVHALIDGREDRHIEVLLVECDISIGGIALPGATVIDHHRPGDPGYGRPPEEFLPASSLGQIIAYLAKNDLVPCDWPSREGGYPDEYAPGCYIRRDRGEVWVVLGGTTKAGTGAIWARVPDDLVLAAAGDHCPGHAYRGECPGVDPDVLMTWRMATRATFQRRDVADILKDIEAARKLLVSAPRLVLEPGIYCQVCDGQGLGPILGETCKTCDGQGYAGMVLIADMRPGQGVTCEAHDWSQWPGCDWHGPAGFDLQCGQCWPYGDTNPCNKFSWSCTGQPVPELPEAALREGIGYIATIREKAQGPHDVPTGPMKIVLGAGSHAQVDAFMKIWAPVQGLMEVYGDPERGFAGGYLARS